jgi:hypothetical protein
LDESLALFADVILNPSFPGEDFQRAISGPWDPALVRQGHDPQLEKAVETIMEQLKKNPPPAYSKPAYPDYHRSVGK